MESFSPKIINGKTYDKYSIDLIVSGTYNSDGQPDASIICNFIPTTIEDGVVQTDQSATTTLRVGSLSQADEDILNVVSTIKEALQNYINTKNI